MDRQPRILMVEDETDVLLLNKAHLEKQGYEVTGAQTLREARRALEKNPPDLILLDVMLPDGTGFDFCREIREYTTAPILYLTAMGASENMVRGFLSGGDDYITKPYDLNVLSARVMAQLRRSGLHGAGRIDMPPLSVNLQNGTAALGGKSIPLTHKELQILAYLMSHAGRECSAEELYEAVWGEAANGATRAVITHISAIRAKLGMDVDSAFEIRSTRSGGYIFLKVSYE